MKRLTFYHAIWQDERPFQLYWPKADHVAVRKPEQLKKPGVLVVWGGQDISTAIYKRPNVATNAPDTISGRDAIEVDLVQGAIKIGMPVFGICRGAQLACALSGGFLIQDVKNHVGNHYVEFKDGSKLPYSSLHHQMMYPWGIPHELLAWTHPISQRFDSEEGKHKPHYIGVTEEELKKITVEPEIVWFPETKCFAVQGHPEYMNPGHPSVQKTMKLFKEKAKV